MLNYKTLTVQDGGKEKERSERGLVKTLPSQEPFRLSTGHDVAHDTVNSRPQSELPDTSLLRTPRRVAKSPAPTKINNRHLNEIRAYIRGPEGVRNKGS